MEEVPNLQNLDLDNNQLDEIEQKSQAKKHTKRATEWGVIREMVRKKNYGASQNSKSN